MEKKNIYLLVGGIALVILSIGVSFAWWGWTSTNNTNVTFTINGLDIEATNTDIKGDVIPVSSKEKIKPIKWDLKKKIPFYRFLLIFYKRIKVLNSIY